jgi:hypothetical protein
MDNLENNLKQWLKIDNLIQEKNNELRELRLLKTSINEKLFSTIEENNLHNSTFKINNNYIKYTTTKQTSSLSLKYLEKCLMEKINDEGSVKDIMMHIKKNRETKIINEIKNNIKE